MCQHVPLLLAFASVLCSQPVYADITSTGTFSNANFIWANGIAGLKFTFTDSCGGIQTCSFSWGHDGSTTLVSRTFTGDIDCPATSGYGLECNSDGFKLVSTITILNGLTKNLTDISISGTTAGSLSRTITLLNCDSSLPGATATLPATCGYNCNANFVCNDGYTGAGFAGECNAFAEWTADNTCVELCDVTNNCKDCVINGGTAPIEVGEKKDATCMAGFSSPDEPQNLTCASAGDALVFDLQCNAPCRVNVTCVNCVHEIPPNSTIQHGQNVTVTCSGNGSEPQVSVCSDGNTVNVNITCDANSTSALISLAGGTVISLGFLAATSAMLSRRTKTQNSSLNSSEPVPEKPSDIVTRSEHATSNISRKPPDPQPKPVVEKPQQRYFQTLWVFALWMASIVLVIVGIGLLAGQYAKCTSPDPAACALVDLAIAGLVLVVLAIAIDLGLIIWVVILTCRPTAPSEKNGGNSIYMNVGSG